MNKETQVAKRESAGALATNFEADANQGTQNMGQEDLALPFLKILGNASPEINPKHAKYVKGSEAGMILNSVSNEFYPAANGTEGINVLPVFYERLYIEWQDRDKSGGAPVKVYKAGEAVPKTTRDAGFKDRLPNGNYLENTVNHYVIVLGNNPSSALISMKATQLKVSRKWNSMMMGTKLQGANGMFTPPTYSHIYNLKTVRMSNNKGQWFGWDVVKVGPIKDKAVYEVAKTFAGRVSKGQVVAKHGTETSTDKELPF